MQSGPVILILPFAAQIAATPTGPALPITQFIPSTAIGKELTLSGYLDIYYQADFGHPGHSQTVSGRWYDIDHDSLQVAAFEVDLSKAVTKTNRLGFTATLLEGSNSSILAATEPGGVKTYKDFSQAYITYLVPTKQNFTIDFGKWYAFVGYEGLDSRTQDNYSRSFTFTSLEPDYMTGFRMTFTESPRLTLNGYLYQGYNEVRNSNSTTMTGFGAAYAANDKLTVTLQGYNGKESDDQLNDAGSYGGIGFPTPGPSWVTQGNLIVVYQQNSKDKFAFDGTYASAVGKGNWNGEAVYYRRQLDARRAACLRVERADDSVGLRFLNGPMVLHSITGTYDYAVSKNLLIRSELRRDYSDHPFFASSSGPSRQRTTFTVAGIVKF